MRVGDEWSALVVGQVVPAGGQQALTLLPSADRFGGMVPAAGGASGPVRVGDVANGAAVVGPLLVGTGVGDVPDVRSEARVISDVAPRFVSFHVLGTPAPKGSNRAMLVGGKARFVPGGSPQNRERMATWDANVREAAATALRDKAAPIFAAMPLRVAIRFFVVRPGGHFGKRGLKPTAPAWPATKPDIDKLVRATLDAMTGTIFDDDSRIVELQASKEWTAGAFYEGAYVTVEAR